MKKEGLGIKPTAGTELEVGLPVHNRKIERAQYLSRGKAFGIFIPLFWTFSLRESANFQFNAKELRRRALGLLRHFLFTPVCDASNTVGNLEKAGLYISITPAKNEE